ncbi:MAG: hypothetical protein HKN19_11385 [Halioglobus sp.]|nr:hypothetical protein [Halioglobus sp.]
MTASPYLLKMQALLDAAQVDWQRWPEQAGRLDALRMAWRLRRAQGAGQVQRVPAMDPALDEYPAVPYYTFDGSTFYYDSTGLALHLDAAPGDAVPPLVPPDPASAFLCHLIDEAFDEFGLYLVHHQRWVPSAATTPMGHRTAREFAPLLPPGVGPLLARRLYRRQANRCPYLFSVAPAGFACGVARDRTPPARPGFPPTHALLEQSWRDYLVAVESVLARQPFLLGDRFTLADASAYGQLGMNLVDGATTDKLRELAPRTYDWLRAIEAGEHAGSAGDLAPGASLAPLLAVIGTTFMPLMAQNLAAYDNAVAAGETLFNEAAFDAGSALYDGELRGQPFRSVVKTFQVAVWRELRARWAALPATPRQQLVDLGLAGTNLLD